MGVAAALWAFSAAAQSSPRWAWGPELELGSRTLPLGDGRLLSCFDDEAKTRCEIVDPLSGEHHAVPVDGPMLDGALALDDGQVLLHSGQSLLDPESGRTRRLPPSGRRLEDLRPIPISGGRAVFLSSPGTPDCHRLLFFLGAERGFREVRASTPTACVTDVYDLGDGTLLVARSPKSLNHPGESDLDLVLLKLDDWTWQQGARLRWRGPRSAFRHAGGIVVLLVDSPTAPYPVQALFLDRAARSPRLKVLAREGLELRAHRFGSDGVVLLERNGAVLWNPQPWSVTPLPFPGPRPSSAVVIERSGQLLVVGPRTGRALVLSRNPPPRRTPCDAVFDYAEAVSAGQDASVFDPRQLDALVPGTAGRACRDYVERQRRFPEALQRPLDALVRRTAGPASVEEETAAQLLCTLLPSWGAPFFARINQGGHLNRGAELCRHADEQMVVIAAAKGPRGASAALVEHAFEQRSGHVAVKSWVVGLLASRDELAQAAGPLLRAAEERGAWHREHLYALLCNPSPRAGFAEACERAWSYEGPEVARDRGRILLNFGLATGVIGGLGTDRRPNLEGTGRRAFRVRGRSALGRLAHQRHAGSGRVVTR